MTDPNGTNGGTLRVFWGDKGISAKGPVVVICLMWLALIGAILYAGYRQEQALAQTVVRVHAEHKAMTRSQDRTSCGLMMTTDERSRFRNEYRPGAWSAWCGWMSNED